MINQWDTSVCNLSGYTQCIVRSLYECITRCINWTDQYTWLIEMLNDVYKTETWYVRMYLNLNVTYWNVWDVSEFDQIRILFVTLSFSFLKKQNKTIYLGTLFPTNFSLRPQIYSNQIGGKLKATLRTNTSSSSPPFSSSFSPYKS